MYGAKPTQPSPAPATDLEVFGSRPLGGMFNELFTQGRKTEDRRQARAMRNIAIVTALQTGEGARKQSNVSLIVMAPLGEDHKIIPAEILTYPVYVVFHHIDFRFFQRVEYSRLSVYDALNPEASRFPSRAALEEVDLQVMAAAELRPELPHERVNRLLQQVKIVDSLIKEQKGFTNARFSPDGIRGLQAGVSPSRANREHLYELKDANIQAYLTAVMDLLVEEPELAPLFTTSDGLAQDNNHLTLEMSIIKDRNLMERLLYRGTQPDLFNHGFRASTNINTQELSLSKDRVAMGRALERDIRRAQMARLLGL